MRLEDYANPNHLGQNGGAFGTSSVEDLVEMQKALEARETTGRETTNLTTESGAPLKLESLEKTLKTLQYKASDIVFWNKVPKKPAYNTVEEFIQETSYGAEMGAFYNEGETPEENVSEFVRRAALVKFMGTTRGVTNPMTLVNIAGNASAIEKETKNGMLWILRTANQALYFGNSSIVPQQFDGLLTLQQSADAFASYNAYMSSDQVIDLRGKALKEENLETAANTIVENYGLADKFYTAPKVMSNFSKRFYGNKYFQVNGPGDPIGAARVGQRVKIFESSFGDVDMEKDIFFNKLPAKKLTSPATSAKAANGPTPAGSGNAVVAVAATATNTKWEAASAGAYYYAVSALNRFGESALVLLENNTTTVVTNGAIDLTFTNTASTYTATGFRVYRSVKSAADTTGDFYPLFDVSLAQLTAGYDGGAAGTIRDLNRWLPDMQQLFLAQNDNEVYEFGQLLPPMKMDLAITGPAYRFMILMYGTMFLYAPKKMVRIINIGTDLT